jgi:hypothetical protein
VTVSRSGDLVAFIRLRNSASSASGKLTWNSRMAVLSLPACWGAFGHGCPLVLSSCRQDAGRAGHDAVVPIASRVALAACDPHP